MVRYDAVTIGSGIGGLLTSVLLAKNKKKVLVLERNTGPGGCCISYERDGFIFDIPSFLTLDNIGELGEFLTETGFYEQVEFVKADCFSKCIYPGLEMVFPAQNLEGCIENLVQAFPEEKNGIQRLFKQMGDLRSPIDKSIRFFELIKFISFSKKSLTISLYDYLKRYVKDDQLISVLGHCWNYFGLPLKQLSGFTVFILAKLLKSPVYIPKKGFQDVTDFLVKKLREYGGEIQFNSSVERILIKDKKAVGVLTSDGREYSAKVVISDIDTEKTFNELLSDMDENVRQVVLDKRRPCHSCFTVQLGTSLDLSKFDLNYGQLFYNEQWDSDTFFEQSSSDVFNVEKADLNFGFHSPTIFSKDLAPEGMHSIHVNLYPVNYSIMSHESDDIKERVAKAVIHRLERIIPGLSASIVVKDVVTPYTLERTLNSTYGAMHDALYSYKEKLILNKSVTPVRNVFMTGTKGFSGLGLPSAMAGGFNAYHAIKKTNRDFL